MKRKIIRVLSLSSIAFMLSGCLNLPFPNFGPSESTDTSNTSTSEPTETSSSSTEQNNPDADFVAEYYQSISNDATGDDLLNQLNALNTSKRKRLITYAGFKDYFQYTERDPQGSTPADKMVGFYDNTLVHYLWDNQATWNREHVWPNSRGGGYVEDDILMPRPASVKINSERGNMVYGTVSGSYDPGTYIAEYRGIAARIILYCAIADKSLVLNESLENDGNNMGILSTLLKWNIEYPPEGYYSDKLALRVEWNRNYVNSVSQNMQGNRNPFVDHPEYACRIWGSRDAKTKQACGLN